MFCWNKGKCVLVVLYHTRYGQRRTQSQPLDWLTRLYWIILASTSSTLPPNGSVSFGQAKTVAADCGMTASRWSLQNCSSDGYVVSSTYPAHPSILCAKETVTGEVDHLGCARELNVVFSFCLRMANTFGSLSFPHRYVQLSTHFHKLCAILQFMWRNIKY